MEDEARDLNIGFISRVTRGRPWVRMKIAATLGSDVPGSGSRYTGLVFVAVMLLAAWVMWQRRYWAVLGFATLMALITVAFSLLLLIASNVLAVAICLAFAGSAGWLFWKLIRVMGRLQAPQRVS